MRSRPLGEDPGDRIGRLYDQYAVGLYRYALVILADAAGAADAVQQVFVALLRGNTFVESDERYLRRAVRNECYSTFRRRQRDPDGLDTPLLEAVPGKDDNPEERMALEQAMRALPPEQREVVHLKVYEGLTKGAAPSPGRAPWLSWLPAAAAAATAILFYTLSANASARVAAHLAPSDGARAAAVADLATQLGDDAFAKLEAERAIGNEDVQAEQAPATDDDLQVTK